MNPISGTYRYPPSGPELKGALAFLADQQEAEELFMVLDEELKMMTRICDGPVSAVGPRLKEMSHLAHTEYYVEGHSPLDPRDILRETLFAPTVTGSPLESACRVISRYEPEGRSYYSGVAALIGSDAAGARTMDSAILIRTVEIEPSGLLSIGSGATLVRHSDPLSEARETQGKVQALLHALEYREPASLAEHPAVLGALSARNTRLASYWLNESAQRPPAAGTGGRKTLIIDAEDTFTAMIGHVLRTLGIEPEIRRYDEDFDVAVYDLVVMGPGPGDPAEAGDPKIAALRQTITRLLDERRPFFAVCLSHQVLSAVLGLRLLRRDTPNQGLQSEIDFFGARRTVGFYNTFAAHHPGPLLRHPGYGDIEVCRDDDNGEVHALRGPGFASLQFHAESVLSPDGLTILRDTVAHVLSSSRPPAAAGRR